MPKGSPVSRVVLPRVKTPRRVHCERIFHWEEELPSTPVAREA